MKRILVLLLTVFATVAIAADNKDENKDIAERIKPIGSVHVAGAAAAAAASSGPRSGADIYNASCVACHGSGVLGAPKLHNGGDWAPRLEKGFDTVWQNALNGVGGMPPMGTCGNCSDDDIKAAIEYMIEGI